MGRPILAVPQKMHRSILTVSGKIGTYMPNYTASLLTYFRKLQLTFDGNYQNTQLTRLIDLPRFMQLTDHHGSLAANGVLNPEYISNFKRLLSSLRTSESQTRRATILASSACGQLCKVLESTYNELS